MLVRGARGGGDHRGVTAWRRRAWRSAIVVVAAIAPLAGCRSHAPAASVVDVTWTLEPAAPVVGPATLTVRVRGRTGEFIKGAGVRLEAYMSHPGMAPVLATAVERPSGHYALSFAFTMPGDWVLLVSAALPDGQRLERRIDVAHVRPAP